MAERIIGGNRFEVAPLPAMASFALQPRLAPVLAEAVALFFSVIQSDDAKKLMGGGGGEIDLKKLSVEQFLNLDLNIEAHAEALVATITRICSKLPPAELVAITKELLYGASMDGLQLFTPNGNPFDQLMRGRTLDTWKLLFFAVQVNYPDVFSRRGASGGATPPAVNASAG